MKPFLSPKEFARAIGASESSLKRWADDGLIKVHRTAGGHRRIAYPEALRYIREHGLPVLKPEILGLGKLWRTVRPGSQAQGDAALMQAVKDGLAELARRLILSAYLDGRSIAELCDRPLTAAMQEVGDLWRHGPEGVFIEHRAVDVCTAALDHLRGILPTAADDAPVAVGGALEDDPYSLPSLMAATVLAAEGWRTVNLGPNLPPRALLCAVEAYKPRLVWLSCSVAEAAEKHRADVRRAAAVLAAQGRSFLVGGRAWAEVRLEGQGIRLVGSMTEVAAFARGLQAAA